MESNKYPRWWSSQHSRFRADLIRGKGKNLKIILTNHLADTVSITRHRKGADEWEVTYTKTIPGHHGHTISVIYMTRDELESAFGIAERNRRDTDWADKFGLQAGVEGAFARTANFLNIPNPAVSAERDQSISILVTKEMQKFIQALIND